jgi:ABC-2 type transport system ATP-binding protein
VLEICSLVKRFAGVHVVRHVSFHVARGEILGYLGPNGSGKSTTFKIIVGLLDATAGHIQLDGRRADEDPCGFRRRLGYVPEEPYLYTHPMATFSKGMRQRVIVAAALLHDPDVLVLDEPFSGLDVDAASLLRALIQALADRGKIILMSSHRMDVVETLCPRVVILHRGEIVAQGAPDALRASRFSASLADVFAAVTEQQDYDARVRAILDATAAS